MSHTLPMPFALERARALAMAAELVYSPALDVVRKVREEWGFDDCEFFNIDDTQVFLASQGDALVVAFRGSEANVADWLTDFSFSLVTGPLEGKVHSGFYDALADVWQLLHEHVLDRDPHQRKTLWVTGHSLGGALATLAAARWLEVGRKVSGLYTFGQPRTGDAAFRRHFNFAMRASTFRFVNDNDLVTQVPPRSLGYCHLGTLKYFSDAGQLERDITWWRLFMDRWKFRWSGWLDGRIEGAEDHSMTGYRTLIEAAADSETRPKTPYSWNPKQPFCSLEPQKPLHAIPRRRVA